MERKKYFPTLLLVLWMCLLSVGEGGRSLTFVIDISGSMEVDIDQIKYTANEVLEAAKNTTRSRVDEFLLVPFGDPTIGPVKTSMDFKVMETVIKSIHPVGGGDCREFSLGGLKLALQKSKPNSLIYLITDAAPKDTDLLPDVVELVMKKKSSIVFLLTSHCTRTHFYEVFEDFSLLAYLSGGQTYPLMCCAFETINTMYSDKRPVGMLYRDTIGGNSVKLTFFVDSTITEMTIVLTGVGVTMTVFEVKEGLKPDNMKYLTSLPYIDILKVSTHPGAYELEITSPKYNLRITAKTPLKFEFGFSKRQVFSLAKTQARPSKGLKTYLYLEVKGLKRGGKVQRVVLINRRGHTVFWHTTLAVPAIKRKFSFAILGVGDRCYFVMVLGLCDKGHKFQRLSDYEVCPEGVEQFPATKPLPPNLGKPPPAGYSCNKVNPCKVQSRRNGLVGRFFYAFDRDPRFYIECTPLGYCLVRPCAAGMKWSESAYSCL